MRCYVLTGNITDKLLKSKWIGIEHQAGLSTLRLATKTSGTQKQAEFERHIEPGQAVLIQFDARDVVNAAAAFTN